MKGSSNCRCWGFLPNCSKYKASGFRQSSDGTHVYEEAVRTEKLYSGSTVEVYSAPLTLDVSMRRWPPRGTSREGRRACPGLGERPTDIGFGTANVAAEAYENPGAF